MATAVATEPAAVNAKGGLEALGLLPEAEELEERCYTRPLVIDFQFKMTIGADTMVARPITFRPLPAKRADRRTERGSMVDMGW